MTQYDTVNVKLSNSEVNKLKPRIKIDTKITLNLLSNVIGNSNDEYNFAYKLLSTKTQVLRLYKALANNSSVNINILKTQLYQIGQPEGRFLVRLLWQLLKIGFSLMMNVLKSLAKIVLIPLALPTAASARHATI